MDPARKKLTAPDYLSTTLAGLDQFFSSAAPGEGNSSGSSASPPEHSARREQEPELEAADLLEFFCGESSITGVAASPLEAMRPEGNLSGLLYTQEKEPCVAQQDHGRQDFHHSIGSRDETVLEYPFYPAYGEGSAGPREPDTPLQVDPLPRTQPAPQAMPADQRGLLAQFQEAQLQLQSARYKIGYLEHEIENYKRQLALMPELEEHLLKIPRLEQENQELRRMVPEVEALSRWLPVIERQNHELRERVEDLELRQSAPWWHFLIRWLGNRKHRRGATHIEPSVPVSYYTNFSRESR